MFGYIRPVHSELLVKEHELYKAAYCGLCRFGGKNISHLTRFLLNYDFVLLALLRIALTGEKTSVSLRRCPYKLKKRSCLECDAAYAYTAGTFAVLAYYNNLDDIEDSSGIKKLFHKSASPFFGHMKKKAGKLECGEEVMRIEGVIRNQLAHLSALEAENSGDIDLTADAFAAITREIACAGLEGVEWEIASQCGYHIGRFIYICDAADDVQEDWDNAGYNPFIALYGSVEEVKKHTEEIRTTLLDSLYAFSSAYGLKQKKNEHLDNIIYNIIELGGAEAAKKAIDRLAKKD